MDAGLSNKWFRKKQANISYKMDFGFNKIKLKTFD